MSSIAPTLEQRRWLVQTARDEFEDVGANWVDVTHGGTLVFYKGTHILNREVAVIYAPGQWLTVVPEETA